MKIYSEEEVLASSLNYFEGDDLSATTWMNKYALKNKRGEYVEKNPDEMHRRLAVEFARMEADFTKKSKPNNSPFVDHEPLTEYTIYSLFKDFSKLIPQGSVLAGLGNNFHLMSLSNCVVLPAVHDSYAGIMERDQQLAQLFKRRCGVGIDISGLRPKGMQVNNAAKTTSGAVSFMERFSNTTREVAQGGRRGALMLTIDVNHPEIEDFITIKRDLSKVTGANISVKVTDEFMEAATQDKEFTLQWPTDSKDPKHQVVVKAKKLWDKIIESAHASAEPGIIFWDAQHTYSTSSVYPQYKNQSTNPCSEIAMQGGDSCRLMALNLFGFIKNPFTPEATFDFEDFKKVVYQSMRLMDDLVELELESIQKIIDRILADDIPEDLKTVELKTWRLLYENGEKGRRTGLGFTALADTVAALGYAFDSEEALLFVDEMMRVKCQSEFESSIDLAIERGAFDGFSPEVENTSDFVKMLSEEFPNTYDRMMKNGRRNVSISTVAPTGTISMLAQTSSGIEPVFMTSYTRRRKLNNDEKVTPDFVDDSGDGWKEFVVYHQKLKMWKELHPKSDDSENPYEGSTASEIDWKKRIQLQAIVQKYTTHSISSTINLPSDTFPERVSEIYEYAWRQNIKGITVYRDGSRSGVLVSTEEKKPEIETVRPDSLVADVVRFNNESEKWLAVIGMLNGRPYEIFTGRLEDSIIIPKWVESGWVNKVKTDTGHRYDFQFLDKDGFKITIEGLSRSFNKEYWNYAKLISGVLRHGMPLDQVVDLVEGLNLYDEHINTWKAGVLRALKKYVPSGTSSSNQCPECDDPEGLVFEEGCLKCKNCGYQKCG